MTWNNNKRTTGLVSGSSVAIRVTTILCVISLFIAGCSAKKPEEAILEDNTAINKKVKKINIAKAVMVQRKDQVKAYGSLKKPEHYDLSFPLAGEVKHLVVAKGSRVVQGRQIASLKPVSLDFKKDQVQFSLQQSNAQLDNLKSQHVTAKRIFDENKILYQDKLITLTELTQSKHYLDDIEAGIQSLQLQKDITAREMNILNEQGNLHLMTAPTSGVILDVNVQNGEHVGAGQPIIILQPDKTSNIFQLSVSDKDIVGLHLGDQVKVKLDAFPHDVFTGVVSYLSFENNGSSTSYEVEVTLKDVNARTLPGLFGEAIIDTGQSHSVLAIPVNALIWADGKKARVLIPNNGNASLREISIQSINDEFVLVRDGLAEGDEVILNANGLIVEGAHIQINSGQ